MRNSAISTKTCQLVATPKTAQIFLIFSAQSLLVKCNKGSLVEQQISRTFFPMLAWATLLYILGYNNVPWKPHDLNIRGLRGPNPGIDAYVIGLVHPLTSTYSHCTTSSIE